MHAFGFAGGFPELFSFLEYGFIQRAIFTGIFVGVASGVLGVFLVLRRYALIGHGLTHVAFGGVAVGLLFSSQPFWWALVVTVLSSVGILKLQERVKMHADVAIGIVSAVGMAAGLIIASVAGGYNVDLMSYLFGSILSISMGEFWVSIVVSAVVIGFIAAAYHDLFAVTFDEESARTMGVRVGFYNYFFTVISAVVVVVGMRVVGLLLISSLVILPAITSLQLSRTFSRCLILSAVVAVISVLGGVFLSYHLRLPSGGAIVAVNFLLFLLAYIYRAVSGR
ncbi:MAG: metal ABC transporter permease [Deltaproteobacteria bacterium]|nr:metal ABC transporter permease [Candidatus Zymogenaceae bacterium]